MTHSARHFVVVLANEMDEAGVPNRETRDRVFLGCSVADRVRAELVLFMGWAYRHDCELTIADAMRRTADTTGWCTPCRTDVNRQSRDTVGDAIFSRVQLAAEPGARLTVATSDYHVPRVREVFQRVWGAAHQIDVLGAPTQNAASRLRSESNSISAFRRMFHGVATGDLSGFVARLLASHPYYNGEMHAERPFVANERLRQLAAQARDC